MESKRVKLGIDVLVEEMPSWLKGMNVGLIANQSSLTRELDRTIDVLHKEPAVNLKALLGPEHGVRQDTTGHPESYTDEETGLPVYQTYGKEMGLRPEMLDGLEALIFDLQDVGNRPWTYKWTMVLGMKAAAERNLKFVVLDRPDPVDGIHVGGCVLDEEHAIWGAYLPIPNRYGLTHGELAVLANEELGIGVDLEVVKMAGWHREMWWDETGLTWANPAVCLPSLETALAYICTAPLQATNVSFGRGTCEIFEVAGAPWINAVQLTSELNSRRLPGVKFRPVYFTPIWPGRDDHDQPCNGTQFHVLDREAFRPVETGLHIIEAIRKLYPEEFKMRLPRIDYYFGSEKVRLQIERGIPVKEIAEDWQEDLAKFLEVRKRCLFYK